MRVALIAAKDFVELTTIREVILAAPGGVTFVIRERESVRDPAAPPPEGSKQHKMILLADILTELGHTAEVVGLDPFFKGSWGDHRAAVRDERIKRECDRVIVFRTPQTKTLEAYRLKEWWQEKAWPHIRVIERGAKAKKVYKKGRAVQ